MDKNTRYTPDRDVENEFRREVRYALDMDVYSRDDQLIEEIKRLKQEHTALCPR